MRLSLGSKEEETQQLMHLASKVFSAKLMRPSLLSIPYKRVTRFPKHFVDVILKVSLARGIFRQGLSRGGPVENLLLFYF